VFLDPNNVDYRDSWPAVGELTRISHEPPHLKLEGRINSAAATTILIVDSVKRFIAAMPVQGELFGVEVSDRHLKLSSWPLHAYAYDPTTNVAHPLTAGAEAQAVKGATSKPPSFKQQQLELIRGAMGQSYTSVSIKDEIKTGNNYQTVDLDTLMLTGGRPARNLFFKHINFKKKRVLDIGANMGELSRLARRRGADFVDGYEYDPLFVETGRMINAASGATRVSLFQGDATNPELYQDMRYDIVLAFSVWVYIGGVLEQIAKVTDVVLFETHTLDHGLDMYIKPMTAHFPEFKILGYDPQRDMRKSRCVLVFAKTRAALIEALRLVKLKTADYFKNSFFEGYGTTTGKEYPALARRVAETRKKDAVFNGIGREYFELLIAGHHDYLQQGRLTPQNVFVAGYRQAIADGRIDSGLRYLLEDETLLLQKVGKKFDDIDNAVAGRWHMVAPVVLRQGEVRHRFTDISGKEVTAEAMDGHHRYFLAQLLSQHTIDALVGEPVSVQRTLLQKKQPT
jgi:SAM-dependent methyltransferase